MGRSRGRASSAKSGHAAIFFGSASSNTDTRAVSAENNRGFSSSAYDRTQGTVVGLQYFRARYFDAELGRFISRDPYKFARGSTLPQSAVMTVSDALFWTNLGPILGPTQEHVGRSSRWLLRVPCPLRHDML